MKKLIVILLIVVAVGGIFLYSTSTKNTAPAGNLDLENLAKERDALVSGLQERLEGIRTGIEDLKKQSALKTGESRNAVEEKIRTLQSEWDDARSQMEKVASAGADQWQSIMGTTLLAFDRVKNTYEATKSELKK